MSYMIIKSEGWNKKIRVGGFWVASTYEGEKGGRRYISALSDTPTTLGGERSHGIRTKI